MTSPSLGYLARRALSLPPREAARRVAGYLRRTTAAWAADRRDRWLPTYRRRAGGPPRLRLELDLDPSRLAPRALADLASCTEHYLRHEFDLLGSGWRDAGYGSEVEGIEGVRYPPPAEALAVARGGAPVRLVTWANRRPARRLHALIDDPAYCPIDWQRDLRSGHRWSNRAGIRELAIGVVPGADIKLPWELSRLQHLPQLALAALLAGRGAPGFRDPVVYTREVRSQCLDFISMNPPRHGACWGCPMDVGIRAANLVLVDALLDGAGTPLDAGCRQALADSLAEHGGHVASHVEWSATGRSNHFLSDLVGLLFCWAALPETAETRGWRDYAGSWLLHETLLQFHPDGGGYEGSTGYHRLSAELVAYGLALLAGGPLRELGWPASLAAAAPPAVRGGIAPGMDTAGLLTRVGGRLRAMSEFCRAVRRPDGRLVQIGDTDSGRLFKLLPVLVEDPARAPAGAPGAGSRREDPLDVGETLAALAALLGEHEDGTRAAPAAAVVRALSRGQVLPGEAPAPPAPVVQSPLDTLLAEVEALPAAARRSLDVELPGFDPRAAVVRRFPDFGLLVVATENFHLLLRCMRPHPDGAPTSHLHDDNLGLDLHAGGRALMSDPGTYVYTPFPELRNAYRVAAAHCVPRAAHWEAVAYTDYLFELHQRATARCLHASTDGLAARLESPEGWVLRVVRFRPGGLSVVDACQPGVLRELFPPVLCCDGYGIRTTRPSRTV